MIWKFKDELSRLKWTWLVVLIFTIFSVFSAKSQCLDGKEKILSLVPTMVRSKFPRVDFEQKKRVMSAHLGLHSGLETQYQIQPIQLSDGLEIRVCHKQKRSYFLKATHFHKGERIEYNPDQFEFVVDGLQRYLDGEIQSFNLSVMSRKIYGPGFYLTHGPFKGETYFAPLWKLNREVKIGLRPVLLGRWINGTLYSQAEECAPNALLLSQKIKAEKANYLVYYCSGQKNDQNTMEILALIENGKPGLVSIDNIAKSGRGVISELREMKDGKMGMEFILQTQFGIYKWDLSFDSKLNIIEGEKVPSDLLSHLSVR